jgi:hypothetical protein
MFVASVLGCEARRNSWPEIAHVHTEQRGRSITIRVPNLLPLARALPADDQCNDEVEAGRRHGIAAEVNAAQLASTLRATERLRG